MKPTTKRIAILTAFLAVFFMPASAAALDMGVMIERIAILTGLPKTAEPQAIREVPMAEVVRRTMKRYARAAYLRGSRQIIHAPGYRFLIPHEATHMLQTDAGQDPATDENEKQAWWIQSVYWRLWPVEAPL